MEPIKSRVAEIVARGRLREAVDEVMPLTLSLRSRVPVRFATILVVGTLQGFEHPKWAEFTRSFEGFCRKGGLEEDARYADSLFKGIVRFVSGETDKSSNELVASLLLFVLYEAETTCKTLASKDSFKACLNIDRTFMDASSRIDALLDVAGGTTTRSVPPIYLQRCRPCPTRPFRRYGRCTNF